MQIREGWRLLHLLENCAQSVNLMTPMASDLIMGHLCAVASDVTVIKLYIPL